MAGSFDICMAKIPNKWRAISTENGVSVISDAEFQRHEKILGVLQASARFFYKNLHMKNLGSRNIKISFSTFIIGPPEKTTKKRAFTKFNLDNMDANYTETPPADHET